MKTSNKNFPRLRITAACIISLFATANATAQTVGGFGLITAQTREDMVIHNLPGSNPYDSSYFHDSLYYYLIDDLGALEFTLSADYIDNTKTVIVDGVEWTERTNLSFDVFDVSIYQGQTFKVGTPGVPITAPIKYSVNLKQKNLNKDAGGYYRVLPNVFLNVLKNEVTRTRIVNGKTVTAPGFPKPYVFRDAPTSTNLYPKWKTYDGSKSEQTKQTPSYYTDKSSGFGYVNIKSVVPLVPDTSLKPELNILYAQDIIHGEFKDYVANRHTQDRYLSVHVKDSPYCIYYQDKNVAAQKEGCFLQLDYVNAVDYPGEKTSINYQADNGSSNRSAGFIGGPGEFSVTATVQKINPDGSVAWSLAPTTITSSSIPTPNGIRFSQDKKTYQVGLDNALISFATPYKSDVDNSKCSRYATPSTMEKIAKYYQGTYSNTGQTTYKPIDTGYFQFANLCAVTFEHVPEGLESDECKPNEPGFCSLNSYLNPSNNGPEDFYPLPSESDLMKGLTFRGKLKNISDDTFKYRIDRVYYDGTKIVSLPRGVFTKKITGVAVPTTGVVVNTTPTTISGDAAALISFTSNKEGVALIGDVSYANEAIESGKVPMLLTPTWSGQTPSTTVTGNKGLVSLVVPLGEEPKGGYSVSYTSSFVNRDGTLTASDSGKLTLPNKAPVINEIKGSEVYLLDGSHSVNGVNQRAKVLSVAGATGIAVVENNPTTNGSVEVVGSDVYYTPHIHTPGWDLVSVKATDLYGAFSYKDFLIDILSDGRIAGSISSQNLTGLVPFKTTLSFIPQTAHQSKLISKVIWEKESSPNNWVALAEGFNPSISIDNAVSINVRAKVVSTFASEQFISEPVTIVGTYAPLPKLTMVPLFDSTIAPARLRLNLKPESALEAKIMSGRKYKVDWSLPVGVTGSGKDFSASLSINEPGSYPITATISDAYNNSFEYVYVAEVSDMTAPVFSLNPKPLLQFERAPMTYALRGALKFSHPKDTATSYELKVDGQSIPLQRANTMPSVISGIGAGTHEISLTVRSKLGVTSTALATVNVAENKIPTCTLSSSPVLKTPLVKVISSCKDADGKIKSINWTINGAPSSKTGSTIFVDMTQQNSYQIGVTATDDSNATGGTSITIN